MGLKAAHRLTAVSRGGRQEGQKEMKKSKGARPSDAPGVFRFVKEIVIFVSGGMDEKMP